jgi:uncharacterized membrane protein
MLRLRSFLQTSFIGGVVVILPLTVLFFAWRWIFVLVAQLLHPLTRLISTGSRMEVFLANLIVIVTILAACFAVGVVVRTRMGRWLYSSFEVHVLKRAPGYSLIRETLMPFILRRKTPFSDVALIHVGDTLMTGFVTDTHGEETCTVFVPTAPNPTTGLILHLDRACVRVVDVPIETAMRSIISCGAGSAPLILAYVARHGPMPGRCAPPAASTQPAAARPPGVAGRTEGQAPP